jgi:hypothetical protein
MQVPSEKNIINCVDDNCIGDLGCRRDHGVGMRIGE